MNDELARKNLRLGLILFAVALFLFGATIAAAYIYRAVD
jgi:hypothetical protein